MSVAPTLQLGTDRITIRVSSDDSDGALFAVDVHMPPGGGPPVMHRHPHGELYLVREGEFAFYLQDADGRVRRRTAGAGEVVAIKGETPHTIRNETAAPATAFGVHAPGAGMEAFARAAAELDHPETETVLALAERHGIEMLGPIP